MVTAQDIFGSKGDNKNPTAQDIFGNTKGFASTGSSGGTQSIKDSLKDVNQSKYGFTGSFVNDVKGFFGDIGDLVSYGWTEFVSNKDNSKGINDWDEYKKRMKQMSTSESAEEYNALYQKMVQDNIVDKDKYEQYQADEKAGKYYKFEQAKSADKQTFFDELDNVMSPIMSKTSNRYQIDSLSKGLQKIEDQYSMFYENVMETYKDTRDERILDEWNKIRKEYENNILQFTKNWANNMVDNNITFSEAYSKTLGEGSNEAFANGISKIERQLSDKMFKFTINQNLTDVGTAAASFNLLKTLDQTLLGLKNGITWGVKQVSNLLEETKQLAGRYDVVEELTNLRVFDEDANVLEKAVGNLGWFANTLIDSLPAYGPAVAELVLARKVEPGMLKTTDKLMDIWKAGDLKRFGTTLGGATLKELALDNLVYDEVFQNMIGRPISNEDENINLMFNLPLDFLQGALQADARWFKPAMKASAFTMDEISPTMLKIIKTSGDSEEELTKLAEKVYLLKGLETTEGTKEAKAFNKGNNTKISSLKEEDEALYNKITKAMNDASGYWDRLTKYEGSAEDLLLGIEEKLGKGVDKLSTIDKLNKASEMVWRQGKFITEAGDNLMLGAKTIGKTIGDLLLSGKISQEDIKVIIKTLSNIAGIDDLIIGLSKGDKDMVNNSLASLTSRQVELGATDINQLYNNILAKLMKQYPELKEFDTIGTYYKGADGLYRNILGDDTRYTADELIDMLGKQSDYNIVGSEEAVLVSNINNAIENLSKLTDDQKLEVKDLTNVFSGLQGGNIFRNWDTKTEAQKKMISQIIHDAGFNFSKAKDEAGNDAGYVQVFGTLANLESLKTNMLGLSGKSLAELTNKDIAAFKVLYANDFINSFDRYLSKVGNLNDVNKELVEKGLVNPKYNSTDFAKSYKSWFESMFEVRTIKDQKGNEQKVYKLKPAFDNEDISSQFTTLMSNSAAYKDIESYAAQNIIKDITSKVVNLDASDETIYNAIHKAVTEGRYVKGYEKEITPVVNSLFNQVKWLGSLGMDANDSATVLGRLFGEIVVDEGTLRTLSRLDSDSLYKGIISRLLLDNDEATALYADSLYKLFDGADAESKVGLKKVIESVEVLGSKLKKETELKQAGNELKKELSNVNRNIKKLQGKEDKGAKRIISKLEGKKKQLIKDYRAKYGAYFDKEGQLTLNEPIAINLDRSALLSKLQGYLENVNPTKFYNRLDELNNQLVKRSKIEKKGAKVTNSEIVIDRVVGASNEDLRLISNLAAYKSFKNANLPVTNEAEILADEIYHSLAMLKEEKDTRKVIFNMGEVKEITPDAINLSVLTETKLLSNIFSQRGLRYAVGSALTSKTTGTSSIDWMNDIKNYIKNVSNRAGMKNIGKEYLMLLSGVEKYIKYGDTAKEQLQSIIETLKTSALLDKNIVVDDLVKSYNTSLAKGDIGLNTNMLFAEKLSKATANLDKTISDLYTTAALYDKVLSNSEKKDILNILGKLEETGRMFDRMGELSKTSKKLNEQDIKKILTTDFSIDELSKKDSLIYKGSNPLEAPKRTGITEINKLRTRGTNERVDDFDVTKPSYDLGDRKLVVYDLETTSTEKDADVTQISYTIISQGKDGKFNVQRHTGNLFDTYKDIDPKASEITGIKKEDLKGKPIFVETKGQGGVYDEFDALSKDPNVLFVGHNIRKFDNEVLHNAGIHIDNNATIDTLTLYQNLIDRVKNNYKLENVPSNFPNIAKALEDMKITSHNADYDTVNNYYLLNYLAEFAMHNNKIDANKSVIDEFINLSKIENVSKEGRNKALAEDTSKSLLQRQLFFEGGQSETNVKAGNSVLRALDNDGFKEGNTIGLEDILPFLGSSLSKDGESKIIAMFDGLKRILPEGATIDKNKLFVGGNVKKAYEEYAAELGFDAISLDDFVLNRIVNSLLTEHGLYNDNTIEALNNYLKRSARLDLISRLVTKTDNNWIQGSTDFIAMGTMFERLYNKALIGKGIEKNSPAYKDMMDEFREYVFNNHNVDLMRFNKSYYQYLLTGDGRYAYSARNIFSIIMEDMFIKQPIQAEDAVIEGGRNINEPKMAKYWNPEQQAVDVVGEFTRSSSRLSPESVSIEDLGKAYDELEERLNLIDDQITKLKKEKRLEKDASKKKEIDEQIAYLNRRYREIGEEQNDIQYREELYKYNTVDYSTTHNYIDESEEAAEGEVKTEQEVLEEVYNGAEDIEKEAPLENDTIKYGENVQSVNEEGAGSAEASRISTLDTETTNALEGDLWNELEDDIIAKGNIEMNNMFHIIEDDKSVYDYKGGQFNTAISMDARINNGADKDKLLEKLNQMDTSYKGDDNIKSFEKGQNGFIYNARNYLEGNDLRITDEQYLKVYSLDSMIGKDIKEGTVTSISIEPTWFDRSVASSAKSEYNHKVFEYKDDFDLYGMLDSIVEVMKRGRGTFILNINHITHKNGKEFVDSIPYSLEQLWVSPIGKALLNKMDIDENYGRYGADAVMKAIEHKMGPSVLNEKLNKDTLMRKYLDVVEIEEGGKTRKIGPRRNWSEDVMVDAIGLSGETRWKYIKDLPNSEKKRIASSVAKNYEDKAKAAVKKSGNGEEISIETEAKIKSIGPESLDNMENLRLYFSEGLISYSLLDESAKRAGYKDMADFVYQTAVNNEGKKKAMDTLGWSLVGDSKFKNEVKSRYDGKLLNLYNKIDSYYSSASDSLLDRLNKYVVKGEDGTEYKFSAYIPDFLEISDRYERTPVKPTMIPKDEKGNFINEEFYEGRYFQDSEDIQVLHGDRWISDEDGLYQLSMDIQKSDDYSTIKNISDPGEIVVRMFNTKTNDFEYGIIKVNDGYYGRNAEGQFEGKPTTYEFYPFEGDKRFEDPISKETKDVSSEVKNYNGLLDDSYYSKPDWLEDALKNNKSIKKEYDEVQEDLEKIRKRLEEARKLGDLSENAEYKAALEDLTKAKIKEDGIIDRLWTGISGIKGSDKGIESKHQVGERVGPLMKYDWKNESFKEALPEGAKKNHIILNENTVKDLDEISEMDMMSKSTNDLWKTRAFSNWTNYDFFDKDKDIQQIVGDRVRFINEQGDNLRAAIDKFDEVLAKQEYTPEEVEKVYTKIRQTANSYIGKNMGDAQKLAIDELPDELVTALNGVAKVFVDGQWTPVHQFATLGKDGFESVLKNIAHNHLGSSLNHFKLGSRDKAKANLLNIIKQYEPREKEALHAAEDLVGDPLGTGAMYSFLTGVRSAWRFIKYGPLFPLTGILMLVNSAVMGTIRYVGEKRGFTDLMDSPWFEALITKAGDDVNIGGVNYKGLGMTDSLNRSNEIMFNSNSDLGGSWFDKCLDTIIKPLPEGKLKTAVTTALKGGTHSLYDLLAQGSVKTMAFAKALARNGITENNIEAFVKAYNNKLVSKEEINKILGDTERIYSRFFTNSATAFFSRHRFSRMYMFNALQGYVINRTDEITSSIKNCVNWINHRHQLAVANGYKGLEGTTWKDFVDYLQTDNQELQSFLMNVLMSAKIGFYMQKMVDGGDMDTENYRRYMIDTSDYLSSIEANFVYSLLMSPFEGMVDYAEYTQNNYDNFDLGQGLTVSGLKTVSDLCSKFFREGKILNAFMDSIVAYGQTGKVDFAYDVLVKDFQKIADGLGRFQLVEGTNLYGLDTLGEDRDILGQILFNNDQTSNSGRVTSKLQSFATVDSILNGEAGSFWKDKMLPYLPIIGPAIQNAIGGNGYSFSAAKYDELIHIMDKDKVVQVLNNWDLGKDNGEDIFGNSNIYSDESIGRMYQELTAFDYPNKQQLSGGKFETGYEYSNEPMKEEVFTKEMLDELGWSEQDLEQFLLDNSNGKNKQAGLMKIMAAAEASRPGSSKIVISYLASQYENDRIKEITGDKYGSWKDLSVQAQNDLQRETVSKFYPRMFLADKTSWYKAITEYVSGKYELFDSLYKDDNLQGYVNTLGYMDMLMYQQAQDGNVNAKFIKNSWSMLAKYMKSEPARINAINYIMDSINKSDMSSGQATSAKMGVLAANMDFYDKYYKNGMAQALYGEDLERYNNYVWGVLKDINEIGLQKAKQQKTSSTGKKKWTPYNYSNPLGENNVPEAQKFIPQAQKYLNGRNPGFGGYSKYTPNTYTPGKTLDWYWKYYEALIKVYSDRLVKSKGKKYPAETIESITFKTGSNNKGRIRAGKLEFPKHKSKQYRTNVISNLPGSHG